ncbi:MAG: DUF357 domain-containing protein [Candidatus Woesearchaeota archaeon]
MLSPNKQKKLRDRISEKILLHYLNITESALKEIIQVLPDSTHLKKIADDFLQMATCYIEDAKYFMKKGDFVNAFGAIYYAHAWLDAGARMGLWDVKHNSNLFTVE